MGAGRRGREDEGPGISVQRQLILGTVGRALAFSTTGTNQDHRIIGIATGMQPASLTAAAVTMDEEEQGQQQQPRPPLAKTCIEPSSYASLAPQPRRRRLIDTESDRGRRLLSILTSHAAPTAPTPAQVHQAAKQSALQERLQQERAEQAERDRQEREERRREREEQEQRRLILERERLESVWASHRSDLSLYRRTSTQPALYWCAAPREDH